MLFLPQKLFKAEDMLRIKEEEFKAEKDRLMKEAAAAKLAFDKIAGCEAQYLVRLASPPYTAYKAKFMLCCLLPRRNSGVWRPSKPSKPSLCRRSCEGRMRWCGRR